MYAAADAAHPTAHGPAAGRRGGRRRVSRSRHSGTDVRPGWLPVAGLFLLLAAALIAAGAMPTLADRSAAPASSHGVTVRASDSLWSIARANRMDGVGTAEMVQAIRRLNDLAPGEDLQPGETVKVPVLVDVAGAVAQR